MAEELADAEAGGAMLSVTAAAASSVPPSGAARCARPTMSGNLTTLRIRSDMDTTSEALAPASSVESWPLWCQIAGSGTLRWR